MMPVNKTQNLPAAIEAEENTAEFVCAEQSLPNHLGLCCSSFEGNHQCHEDQVSWSLPKSSQAKLNML
jgi:hypothetical protein